MSTNEQINVTPGHIEVLPIAGRIGAEIKGVSLHADLDTQTVKTIREALLQHKVIFYS